jgi:hypothetical protein
MPTPSQTRRAGSSASCPPSSHPNLSGLAADHVAHRAAFAAARDHGRFVILHTGRFTAPGYRSLRAADPRDFVDLFDAYPSSRSP